MALWSNKTVQVPGLASVYASTGPITAESRRHYILDTTSNTIVVNLPIGIDGTTIRITDAKGTFLTNNVTVNPASGQKINNLATNEPLILDANEMWIEFTWNASAGSWIVNAPGILALITDTYTDYPYITSPSSPATSTLRLYAKSDGKLYTKNPAGVESKVGGGLEHPTNGSTFEVDSFNLSMTGTNNTVIGVGSGNSMTTAAYNTIFGKGCANNLTTGQFNIVLGVDAATSLIDGYNNIALGWDALRSNVSGYTNIAIGVSALASYVGGVGEGQNVGIGYAALNGVDGGYGNVGIGDSVISGGMSPSISSYNSVFIGRQIDAGFSVSTLSDVVAIGSNIEVTKSNQFILGNSNSLYNLPGIAETALTLGPTGTSAGQTGVIRFRELAANGTNSVAFKAADNIATNVTWTLPAADGTNGQALITNGSGTLSWAAAGNTIVLVTQNTHGFTAADVGRPLYLNGSTYTYARADLEATAEVAGLIYSIIDTNTFQICLGGEVTSVGANLVDGGGSLVAGEVYFLSPTTAGKITTTPPSVIGQISKPVGVARTTTALDFYNMRGSAVGGSNVYTQISLANAVATTIQNASAYNAVELVGFIYINATTPYRFTFKAQVTKKGDATDYLISYQTSGDTPPVGFNISVTTGGLVQATLPSVAGFTSAIAQFSLNGPAVGASLPLSIDSSNVSFGTVQAKDSSGVFIKDSTATNRLTVTSSQITASSPVSLSSGIVTTYSVTLSGTYSAGTFYSVATNVNLGSGTFIAYVYMDTYIAGGAGYNWTWVSVPFFLANVTTNSGDSISLPTMIGDGHARNGMNSPTVRIRQSPSAGDGKTYIDVSFAITLTGIDNTAGKMASVYFKRIA
jgi:hypothetical protein